jgi:hypothetical protein
MATTVVNLAKGEAYDVYIGRPGKGQDGYFGNPHTMGRIYCPACQSWHDRPSAIAAYKKDFLKRVKEDMEFFARVIELKDKRLGCFCSPLPCHGDVIAEWLDAH